jgi:uncharacterized membrane protein YesL
MLYCSVTAHNSPHRANFPIDKDLYVVKLATHTFKQSILSVTQIFSLFLPEKIILTRKKIN